MSDDDTITLDEHLIRAAHSSNLRLSEIRRGDADYLIAQGLAGRAHDAAGKVPEYILLRHDLAGRLLRLQDEWDRVKRQIDMAREYQSPYRQRAIDARAKVWKGKTSLHGPTQELKWIAIAEEEEASVVSGARAHAMLSLKCLIGTKETLHRFAEIEATRRKYMVTDAEVARLVGPVLELHLDPNCYKCLGRGKIGALGSTPKICPVCSGTGRRGARKNGIGTAIGNTPEQHKFSAYLLAEIDQMRAQMRTRTANYLKGA